MLDHHAHLPHNPKAWSTSKPRKTIRLFLKSAGLVFASRFPPTLAAAPGAFDPEVADPVTKCRALAGPSALGPLGTIKKENDFNTISKNPQHLQMVFGQNNTIANSSCAVTN